MGSDNIIKDKSYDFALRVVKLYKYLVFEKKEYILSKQILRSGTFIGANIEESIGGMSEKDFLFKLTISYKEARETKYWIRLLRDSDYIDRISAQSILNDCEEICRILGKIQSTLRKKLN